MRSLKFSSASNYAEEISKIPSLEPVFTSFSSSAVCKKYLSPEYFCSDCPSSLKNERSWRSLCIVTVSGSAVCVTLQLPADDRAFSPPHLQRDLGRDQAPPHGARRGVSGQPREGKHQPHPAGRAAAAQVRNVPWPLWFQRTALSSQLWWVPCDSQQVESHPECSLKKMTLVTFRSCFVWPGRRFCFVFRSVKEQWVSSLRQMAPTYGGFFFR